MKFFTTIKLSANREKTPEGFLIVRNVPIARTGVQEYGPGESAIKVGPGGRALVAREASEVFAPKTIASVNGKALTNNHPDDDVTPKNWRELAYGTFFDARRGTGIDEDILFADLIVQDADGIGLIESGKDELSCGYDAEYEQTGEGTGRQKNIIVNHIALVDSGRCGPRCSVSDHKVTHDCNCPKEAKNMSLKNRVRDALRLAGVKVKDEAGMEEIMNKVTGDEAEPMGGAGDGETHVHIHMGEKGAGGMPTDVHDDTDPEGSGGEDDPPQWFKDYSKTSDERMGKMEKILEGIQGGGGGRSDDKTKDEEETEGEMEAAAPEMPVEDMRKVKDSAILEDSFQNTISLAEIIAPGISFPTFDRAAAPGKTVAQVHTLRARTLDLAWNLAETRSIIEDVTGNDRQPDFKAMKTKDLRTLFHAVGAAKKRINATRDDGRGFSVTGSKPVGGVLTLADLNKRNAEYYSKH